MNKQPVQSSNISSIGYDSDSQILEVEFNNGSIYQYYNVPEEEYDGLMEATSHGKYLNSNIKGSYDYEQL